jgi:hypothetical protein
LRFYKGEKLKKKHTAPQKVRCYLGQLNEVFFHLFGHVATSEQMSNYFIQDLERLLSVPINRTTILKETFRS